MKISTFRMRMDVQGDLVDLKDSRARLSSYFVWNKCDGKFLQFTKLRGVAQELLTAEKVRQSDYLEANLGIPLFSPHARDIFMAEFPAEMEFHDIVVESNGQGFPFFACRVVPRAKIIDVSRSDFMGIPRGERIVVKPAYFSDFDVNFNIARDEKYDAYLVVSENFVDVCKKSRLEIDFVGLD